MAFQSEESKKLMLHFPIHWLVWHNDFEELDKALVEKKSDIEKLDPRGRSPLMLAVTLGFLESTRVLLRHDASVDTTNKDGWTIVQEAVATGDPELVQAVVEKRDKNRYSSRVGGIPELLQRLQDAPDFYVEMKWEFTSWVPLVSRMCPSDTYKVYKRGCNVRIDTTLLGFEQSTWQRGNRSYIFKGQRDTALMIEIDHDTKHVYVEQQSILASQGIDVTYGRSTEEVVAARLTSPIVSTFIDTEKISFERNRSGIWGWRSDKTEVVNDYDCKVYNACNVELVTKTRTEHLTDADKNKNKQSKSSFESFLGIAETEETPNRSFPNGEGLVSVSNPCNITAEEYFDENFDLNERDIGRPKEVSNKIQKFKANLWLCDNYPLSLQEQVLPVVDLMAISNSHFAKLKDFITLQLPSGFPIKIEIPLFHILNARVTFGNIFAMESPVQGVSTIEEENGLSCVLCDSIFEPPPDYLRLGADSRRQFSMEDDDELMQCAIQNSLMEEGSERDKVTIWEALRNQRPLHSNANLLYPEEDEQIQMAIHDSLLLYQLQNGFESNESGALDQPLTNPSVESPLSIDDQLRLAIELSEKEKQEEEKRLKAEDDILEKVLQLSLTET